jgi:hypothetical protein
MGDTVDSGASKGVELEEDELEEDELTRGVGIMGAAEVAAKSDAASYTYESLIIVDSLPPNISNFSPITIGAFSPTHIGKFLPISIGAFSPTSTGKLLPINIGEFSPTNTGKFLPINIGAFSSTQDMPTGLWSDSPETDTKTGILKI